MGRRESLACDPLAGLYREFMSTAEIQKMSTGERLAAMEQLWDALCHDGTELASPAWHETVLAKRKERMNSSDARYFTLEEIRDQLS